MATTKKKETGVATVASDAALAALRQEFPTEPSFNRVLLPRLGLVTQDITEESRDPKTKKKVVNIVTEAGTFYTEHQSEEVNPETQQKEWEREELGTETEGIILFQRKQLKFYDGEKYTSSPVYDSDDEVLPLFKDKVEVDRGTPAELKSRDIYQGKSAKGKDVSKLEDNRVLYVLKDGEIYQLNLRGTSMYAYMQYGRKVTPNTVVTAFNSEPKENGATQWNQMTFTVVRPVNGEEAPDIIAKIQEIKQGIAQEKGFYSSQKSAEDRQADEDLRKF